MEHSIRKTIIGLAVAGTYVITPSANAQSVISKAPIQIRKIKEEVSSSENKKKKVPIKATYSEHVITNKRIRLASPMANAQTILASKPSINAFSNGPNGVQSTITFRAFNSGQFSETFDGISLNSAFNGSATNAASERNSIPLTLNDVSGINIYNGINNPSVNSYNSLGGTINYQPRKPSRTMGGSIGMGYGSFGTFQSNALFNTGSIDGFRSLFAYNRQTSNGWLDNSGNDNTNYYYAGILPYDHGQSKISAYVIVNHNIGYSPHSVPLALLHKDGYNFDWPLSWNYTTNNDTSLTTIVGDKTAINEHVVVNTKVFAQNDNYHRTSYSNPAFSQSASQPYYLPNPPLNSAFWLTYPTPPGYNPGAIFGSTQNGTDYQYYEGINSTLGFTPSVQLFLPYNEVVIGGNITYSLRHDGKFVYGSFAAPHISQYNNLWDEHNSRLLTSVYLQDNISLLHGKIHITPGFKYLYADTVSSNDIGIFYPIGGSVGNSQAFTSPTIGISYTPIHNVSFYGSFGRNIKFPNITAYFGNIAELNSNGQYQSVPVTVTPEYVTDYEIGMRYRNKRFMGSIDAYREDFTNTFINTINPSSSLATTVNGGSSQYEGIELSLVQNLGHFLFGHWDVNANYSYNQAIFTSSFDSAYAGAVQSGQPLANVPKTMFNVGMDWYFHHLQAHINGKYVSTQYVSQIFSGTPSSLTIPAYFLLNAGIVDTIPVNNQYVKNIKLSLNIDNLLNRRYFPQGYSYNTYNGSPYLSVLEGMPRFIFGDITVRF